MTRLSLSSVAALVRHVVSICTALLVASCSNWQHSQEEVSSPRQVTRPRAELAQMSFGPHAEFVLCIDPACPKATAKTLAPPPPPPPKSTSPARPSPPAATAPEGQAEEEFLALPPRPPEELQTTAEPTPTPLSKSVTVHFKVCSAALSSADEAALDRAVTAATDATSILISGRTDSTGSTRANELLAAARTRSVHDYLRASHPHLAPVLVLDPKGTCCYVEPNDTAQGRGLNRRVDVIFSKDAATTLASIRPQPQSPTAFPRPHPQPTR